LLTRAAAAPPRVVREIWLRGGRGGDKIIGKVIEAYGHFDAWHRGEFVGRFEDVGLATWAADGR